MIKNTSSEITPSILLKVALPLMLSAMSGTIMSCVDRFMLIHYSLEAHNAAVQAMNLSNVFINAVVMLATTSQIFVAQNFGAGKRNSELSPPIWQMIWVFLGSALLFWPLSLWGSGFFFTAEQEMQKNYLSWMLFFVPFHGLFGTLAGFFLGQKLFKLPSLVIFFGNLLNMALGYLLIFGIEGWIPSLGTTGAVIGLNASLILQVLTLFMGFIKKVSKDANYLSYMTFSPPLLFQCLKVSIPTTLFGILETAGWCCFYMMMGQLSVHHLTIAGIVQNVLIFFFFIGSGLSGAVSTLAGNAIGSNQPEKVEKIVFSGYILTCYFGIFLVGSLLLSYNWVIHCFLGHLPREEILELYPALLFGLFNSIVYKFLEWIRLVLHGALLAAADTNFLLIGGSLSVWAFMVLPVYCWVVRMSGPIELALLLCSAYTFFSALLYLVRFYQGAWKNKPLMTAVKL